MNEENLLVFLFGIFAERCNYPIKLVDFYRYLMKCAESNILPLDERKRLLRAYSGNITWLGLVLDVLRQQGLFAPGGTEFALSAQGSKRYHSVRSRVKRNATALKRMADEVLAEAAAA